MLEGHQGSLLSRRAVLIATAAAFAGACSGTPPAPGLRDGSSSSSTAGSSAPQLTTGAGSRGAAGQPGGATPTYGPRLIAARATIPVLCWHQLRPWRSSDSAYERQTLICPPRSFRAQLDALAAAGHTTIGPDQYLAYLEHGTPLPPKPVLLSLDDAQASQIDVGLPELRRRGMTATFFIMTVVLGKRGWMSPDDVRSLHRAGMTIGAHTWDHHRADQYSGADWTLQLDKPRTELQRIIGAPVRHFAYPYGLWRSADFAHLRAAGYATAFQLGARLDREQPLLTLRRQIVGSTWGADQLRRALASF